MNQSLPWNGYSASLKPCIGDSCFHVYDSYDLVLPPMEENALFVTSNMWVTKNQTRGLCPGYRKDNSCGGKTGNNCTALKQVQDGLQTGLDGSCRSTKDYKDPSQPWPQSIPSGSFCDVYTWCPAELEVTNSTIINNFAIQGVKDFTVFVRMNVKFPCPGFDYVLDNAGGSNTTSNYGTADVSTVNLWTLEDMVNLAGNQWEDVQNQGMMIGMNAVWNCDFDQSVDGCAPTVTFVRLDNPNSTLSKGYNFRSAEYLPPVTRQLTKHYGIRLLVLVSGVGKQKDLVAALTAIGAGIGLLSVATLIADMVATKLLAQKHLYNAAKYNEVDVPDHDVHDDEDGGTGARAQSSDGTYHPPGNHGSLLSGEDLENEEEQHVESWGVARFPTVQQGKEKK